MGNLGYLAFTMVYKLLPLGIGATVIATNPFAISIMAYLFLGEKTSFFEVAAICVSFAGIAMMAFSQPENNDEG